MHHLRYGDIPLIAKASFSIFIKWWPHANKDSCFLRVVDQREGSGGERLSAYHCFIKRQFSQLKSVIFLSQKHNISIAKPRSLFSTSILCIYIIYACKCNPMYVLIKPYLCLFWYHYTLHPSGLRLAQEILKHIFSNIHL